MDTNDTNLSIDSLDSTDLSSSWSGESVRLRRPSTDEDAEHLFTLLANLGDGEMKGYRNVKAKELGTIVQWPKRDDRDDRITDAAELLEARGLVHLERETCPALIQLSMKGRAEARMRGVALAGAPVEDARWLLQQLVARGNLMPSDTYLVQLTRWPWPRITDALTVLDQLDLVEFNGDDDTNDSDDCMRDEIQIWESGVAAARDGYGWDAVPRHWAASSEIHRGTLAREVLLDDHQMWPSRAAR